MDRDRDIERINELLAEIDRLTRQLAEARKALQALHHAVCHETGFAAAVRQDSGKAYPWEALEIADDMARRALAHTAAMETERREALDALAAHDQDLGLYADKK